jgi:signal transduction histidine kinase/ligand-binding sensor domain-containing protein
MRHFKTYGLIASFVLFSHSLTAQAKTAAFEKLGTEQGLSSNVVTCMLKDSKGFLWFGTQEGLNKYDAYQFSIYLNDKNAGSLSDNYILSIYEDSAQQIWIGTESNGLNKYNAEKDNFSYFPADSSNIVHFKRVLSIHESDPDKLILGTDNGLVSFNKKTNSFSKYTLPIIDNTIENLWVNIIFQDEDKTLWLGTNHGLIHYLPPLDSIEHYKSIDGNHFNLSNNTVSSILRRTDGTLLIGTNAGINKFNEIDRTFTQFNLDSGDPDFMAKSEIQDMVEDGFGNLWIASFGRGLINFNQSTRQGTVFIHDSKDNESISNDHIYSLLYDNNGILWMGTYGGGINKLVLANKQFNHLSLTTYDPLKLIENNVNAIYVDQKYIWYGTSKGLSIYDQNEEIYYQSFADPENRVSLSDNNIFCIFKDHSGTIWVGTEKGGLNKLTGFDPANQIFIFDHFTLEDGLNSNEVLCLFEDQEKQLWVGTNEGINIVKNNKVVSGFQSDEENESSLSDNEVYTIIQDRNGKIWIGTMSGLNLYNPVNESFLSIPGNSETDTPPSVYCLFEDKEGILWAGTDNNGLLRIDTEKEKIVNTYTKAEGLPDNVIYGIIEDENLNLWLSSNKGIIKAVKHGSKTLTFVSYGSSVGLVAEAFNIGAYAESKSGYLYFGNYEGVTWFHPENVKGNIQEPPVYITGFQLFFKPVPITNDGSSPLSRTISATQKLVLKHNQNVIRFSFTALNYIQPESNEFAIKMEGVDEDWNFVGNQREAQYLYLPPGNYTFRVKASNNDGLWNETGASIDITIEPPFTSTLWFYLLVISLLSIAIIWIFNSRTRRLREARNKLEKTVQKRTAELRRTNKNLEEEIFERKKIENQLVDKNEELNSALDNLKKTQAQLVDSEKMASLGQLTAGIAHEINNPINFVSGNVNPLRRNINDIIEILNTYDKIVSSRKLQKEFEKIEILKKDIDYDVIPDEINKLLNGIGEGASRTSEIVKGLRNFTRMDEHELKPANINQGIDSTLLILQNKLKNRIRVFKNFGQFPDILCYPGQLNQVFLNIINNAQEAIKDSGEIHITTQIEGDNLCISIKDNGRGMTPDTKKKIFEPFFTTKDVGKGTGLGLAISYGIIVKHNGKIEFSSELNKGTEFKIIIPANQPG